jgi:SAM-dependent methyltransferase
MLGSRQVEDLAAVSPTPRGLLTRFLSGSGVELGPGHHPMPLLFPGVSVRYVDRWQPEENLALFTDLEAGATFPKPDIVANLDVDGLAALPDASQDFVIASHLLEHLADPLMQIDEIHRVLKPGAVVLVFLPDRRHTFDRKRSATPLAHLIAEHRDRVTVVSDEHIEEYLRKVDVWEPSWTPEQEHEQFELNRQRSIHVHCWSEDEFLPVLEHTVLEMGMRWELLDAMFVEDVPEGFEFGFVLRRSPVAAEPAVMAEHLRLSWQVLASKSRQHAEAQRQIARLRALPGFPVMRRAWRVQRRLRQDLSKALDGTRAATVFSSGRRSLRLQHRRDRAHDEDQGKVGERVVEQHRRSV